ncbi:MAG TPA: hypothetical protein VE173_12410, partial [Longimicrobiales bacterium]|nr:hypothetical protein [Longimicrobiales bacterium]
MDSIPSLRIGVVSGDPAAELSAIRDVAELSDGRIVVAAFPWSAGEDAGAGSGEAQLVRNSVVVRVIPPGGEIRISPSGQVWVRQYAPGSPETLTWWVFEADGGSWAASTSRVASPSTRLPTTRC